MKRLLYIIAILSISAYAGCDRVDREITDVEHRVDILEDYSIKTIDHQIDAIHTSIADLEAMDAALSQLIDNLETKADELQQQLDNNADADAQTKAAIEAEIKAIKELIEALQQKDEELDQKIADLRTYVDDEITATEDWANATFATLDQYAAMSQTIADIQALIEQYKSEITADYTKAIETAIATSEASMKSWVNEELQKVYGNITDLQSQITSIINNGATDDELKNAIDDQQKALSKAVKDLTEAYEKAIEDAITTNNGVINQEIAKQVKAAQDNLQTQINAINDEITKIKDRLDKIEASISTINQQIEGINQSIDDLKEVDKTLKGLIDNLEADVEDLQRQLEENDKADAQTKAAIEAEIKAIKELIEALQQKDEELDQKIADLRTYVDNEITATEDWANATFATLDQYAAMSQTIADIQALVEQYKSEITAGYTKAIEEAIATSEASMKSWVNETLANGYYDIAEIDAKLSALETRLNGANEELAKQIAAHQATIEQTKRELTEAYEKAIEDAIATNNGIINQAISDAIKGALDKVDARLAIIEGIISDIQREINVIKANILKIEGQISDINSSINELKSTDVELQGLIDDLEADVDDLQRQLEENADADAQTKAAIEAEIKAIKELIKALQQKDAELDQKIAEYEQDLANLKTYIDGKISDVEDLLDQTINNRIATLQNDINTDLTAITNDIDSICSEIESIKKRIDNITNELDNLKNSFAGRIQSLVYIPEYSDGKAAMEYNSRKTTLDFIVTPMSVVQDLKAAFDADNNVIRAYVRYTKTRAVADAIEQSVESMTIGTDGLFTLTIAENGLSQEFWKGNEEAIIYIYISDGNNDIISDTIPLIAVGYL